MYSWDASFPLQEDANREMQAGVFCTFYFIAIFPLNVKHIFSLTIHLPADAYVIQLASCLSFNPHSTHPRNHSFNKYLQSFGYIERI
jgi:hypothetical protein